MRFHLFASVSASSALVVIAGSLTAPPVRAQTTDPKAIVAELGLQESAKPVRELPGWRAPKKIVILAFTAAQVARLQAAAPGVELVAAAASRNDPSIAAGADAIIGPCLPAFIAASKDVRWMHSLSAGVEDCVSMPAIRERNILLTNMQHVSAATIGEHGVALMLALTRRLDSYVRQQSQGSWAPLGRSAVVSGQASNAMPVINGKTALVVGLGGIGTEFAKRAHALGMKVIATRNSGRTGPEFVSYVGGPDELLTLAKDADVIFSALPLTPATTDLLDAKFFSVLKPSAYLINVGRGKTIVTSALIDALNTGKLAGAGLDVTEPEPLPADHPLWKAPNLIITPHVAARSDLPPDKSWAVVYEQIRRYAAGEKMLSVVDLERGY